MGGGNRSGTCWKEGAWYGRDENKRGYEREYDENIIYACMYIFIYEIRKEFFKSSK